MNGFDAISPYMIDDAAGGSGGEPGVITAASARVLVNAIKDVVAGSMILALIMIASGAVQAQLASNEVAYAAIYILRMCVMAALGVSMLILALVSVLLIAAPSSFDRWYAARKTTRDEGSRRTQSTEMKGPFL